MRGAIDTCLGCPDRYRIIAESGVKDCHDHCERYKAAIATRQENKKKYIDSIRNDKTMMVYLSTRKGRKFK